MVSDFYYKITKKSVCKTPFQVKDASHLKSMLGTIINRCIDNTYLKKKSSIWILSLLNNLSSLTWCLQWFKTDPKHTSSHQRCSMKKDLKISQNSQENTCARVSSLLKLQASGLQLYWRRDSRAVFSCEFCEISNNIFFTEHLWTTASTNIC